MKFLLSSCSLEKSPSKSNLTSGNTGELDLGGSSSFLSFFLLKKLNLDGFSFSFVDLTSMKTCSSLGSLVFADNSQDVDDFISKHLEIHLRKKKVPLKPIRLDILFNFCLNKSKENTLINCSNQQ